MYTAHFGLARRPFSLAPDPDFLFWTEQHKTGSAMLELGMNQLSPLTVVTGDVGAGKTTLVRNFIRNAPPDLTIGLLSKFPDGKGDLLQWVLMTFDQDLSEAESIGPLKAIESFLISEYAAGRRTVLIVDEAQNVSDDEMEHLRLLTNINADKDVLLLLIIVGQPQLRARLARPGLRQITQRIGADFHLNTMSFEDTCGYVRFRLTAAGGSPDLFEDEALAAIHRLTGGVPRKVNILCDYSLVAAYGSGDSGVSVDLVLKVVEDAYSSGVLASLTEHFDPDDPTGPPERKAVETPIEIAEAAALQAVASKVVGIDGRPAETIPPGRHNRQEGREATARYHQDQDAIRDRQHIRAVPTPNPASAPGVSGGSGGFHRLEGKSQAPTAPGSSKKRTANFFDGMDNAGQRHRGAEDISAVQDNDEAAEAVTAPETQAPPTDFAEADSLNHALPEDREPTLVHPEEDIHSDEDLATSQPDAKAEVEKKAEEEEPDTALIAPAEEGERSRRPLIIGGLVAAAAITGVVVLRDDGADLLDPVAPYQASLSAPLAELETPDPAAEQAATLAALAPFEQPRALLAASLIAAPQSEFSTPAVAGEPAVSSTLVPATNRAETEAGPLSQLAASVPTTVAAFAEADAALALDLDAVTTSGPVVSPPDPPGNPGSALDDTLSLMATIPVGTQDPELILSEGAAKPDAARGYFADALQAAEDDLRAAVGYYALSALLGHDRAALYLGQIYETGDGVAADPKLAQNWYSAAGEPLDPLGGGDAGAAEKLAPPELFLRRPVDGGATALVWTSGPGADPDYYMIEIAVEPGATPIRSTPTRLSAALVSMPEGAAFWRVLAVDVAGARYSASPWSAVGDTQATPPADTVVSGVTIVHADPALDEAAAGLMAELSENGVAARVEQLDAMPAARNSVRYFYAEDEAAAKRLAKTVPGGAIALIDPQVAGIANPALGSLIVTLVSGG